MTDTAKRQAYLDQLRRMLPSSTPWEAWLDETGELPPDFDALSTMPGLPDPLLREVDGQRVPVTTAQEWQVRREELKALFHYWVLGQVPPPPQNLEARVIDHRQEAGAVVRQVELTFGPGRRARLRLDLLIPEGDGPFPVFLTQWSHRGWALIALRRGYLGCIYAGSDFHDDTDTFVEAFPDYDWSRLTRRAWAASRCIDYLATLPQADTQRVALTGHSRNGKQSLIASALDERIALVISSSSGAGGDMPARFTSDMHFGESVESLTRTFPDWFHPRLRFFTGREQKLPVDLHELVALSAPRPCLLSMAINDGVSSSWAMQQTYLSVQRVYRLLGAEDRLRILWRPGAHETWATIIERYLDWCDLHLQQDFPAASGGRSFGERLLHPWDWEAWRQASGEQPISAGQAPHGLDNTSALDDHSPVPDRATWEKKREQVRTAVRWMLGEQPPQAKSLGAQYGREPPHIAALLGRSSAGPRLEKAQLSFGEDLAGDVYFPTGLRESGYKAPAVLWLHPFNAPTGYMAWYRQDGAGPGGQQAYTTFAQAGFVVFCFDQIGCGRRVEEAEGFCARHPHWSLLGKMVRDAQAALDVLAALPYADPDAIWGVGYSMGSLVGLHLAALDDRLAGLASVCGPPPFRLDTSSKGTGGIRRWSHLYMLLPRLGLFVGQEESVPYDLHHLLSCLAPRPSLMVSPQLDREAQLEDVTRAVQAAREVYALYGASDRLEQISPEGYNHFGPGMQALVARWLDQVSGRSL